MGNADSIPVVSQAKSLVQVIGGDADGALRTQENFSRQCPVVSQTRSLVEVSAGDPEAARKTQEEFGRGMSDFADRIPVVGHVKGGIHYACGDRDGGDKAMMRATRGLVFSPALAMVMESDSDGEESSGIPIVVINTRVAKDFNGVPLSDWTRALDDQPAVACLKVVEALNQRKNRNGVDYLKWDDVVDVFCCCHHITKDVGDSKHIGGEYTFDETNFFKFDGSPDEFRKKEIITWLKDLMNRHGEQATFDNAVIFNDRTLDRLAGIASQTGASVKDPLSLLGAAEKQKEKVMEISVIRFPQKFDCKIKLYRIIIFAWFKCTRVLFGQHDESGFEFDYDSYVFRPNSAAIDKHCALRAREDLSKPGMFDF